MGCCCGRHARREEKLHLLAADNQKVASKTSQYILKEVIGSGTTSICYLCTRQATANGRDEDLACKVVDKYKLGIDKSVRGLLLNQLRNEIEILQKLKHPNVIKLVDVFETESKVYIVTELMRGGELFDRIVAKGKLSEREAAHIISQVATGLAHCHQKGVVHRDLKPENLLLQLDKKDKAKDNEFGFKVKIADFGFSRTLQENATMSYIGTAGYLAPELRQGKSYTKVVDIWALGVITYVLLSGHLPFAPDTEPIIHGGMPVQDFALTFPSREWQDISNDAKELIWAMLQVDPILRCDAKHVRDHPWANGKSATYRREALKSVSELAKYPRRFQSFFIEPHTKTQTSLRLGSGEKKKKVNRKKVDSALKNAHSDHLHSKAKTEALKARATAPAFRPSPRPPVYRKSSSRRGSSFHDLSKAVDGKVAKPTKRIVRKSPVLKSMEISASNASAMQAWQLSEDPSRCRAALPSLGRGYQSDETND